MKKMLLLVMALLSIVSVKLYSSNQELVFEEPPVVQRDVKPTSSCQYWEGADDCTPGSDNYCAAIYEDGKCNSDPPAI